VSGILFLAAPPQREEQNRYRTCNYYSSNHDNVILSNIHLPMFILSNAILAPMHHVPGGTTTAFHEGIG
jgi:uncharacterized membrane protein YGL010W